MQQKIVVPRSLRHPHRLARLLAASILITSVTAGSLATTGTAETASAAPRKPRIVVQSIQPAEPGPKSTLRIRGRVRAGSRALDSVSVRLRFSSEAFSIRSVMDLYAAGGRSAKFSTRPLYSTSVSIGRTLQPNQSAKFQVAVPMSELDLGNFGVYPVAVEAVSAGRSVTRQRTFLPYVPANTNVKPTRVAWLWPLIDRPHRTVNGTFMDNRLARTLSGKGRLGRLLQAARSVSPPQGSTQFPLLWAVDPALLEAARAMASEDGYTVRKGSGTQARERESSTHAKKWLSQLRDGVSGQTVFSMPYADPDIMALHRAGLDQSLTLAITAGENVTESVLDQQVTPNVVWPPGGWLNQDTLDTLAVAGTKTVILNERSLPPAEQHKYTPGVATQTPKIGGTVDALVADSTVTRILGNVGEGSRTAALQRQRFLAETAFITDERPYTKATLLIAPPRRWDPPPGFARTVLDDSRRVHWLRPVGRSYLAEHASGVQRSSLRYPQAARKRELSQRYLAGVGQIKRKMERLSSITASSDDRFDFSILRAESSAWRARPALGKELRNRVEQELTEARDKVRILPSEPVVLASNSGTIGVTVANDLKEQTVKVGLAIRPRNRARLDVGNVPDQITVTPGGKVTKTIRVESVTSGVADVTLQLRTPDGKDFGKPVHLEIRAAGYDTAALGVTAGAAAVLFLAVVIRLIRRTAGSAAREGAREPEATEDTEAAQDREENT